MSEDRERVIALRRCFIDTIEDHLDAMYRTAYRMLRDSADAQDAVQDALDKGWRGLGGFKHGQPMKPWLFRILTNVCIDHQRARARTADLRNDCDVEAIEAREGRQHERRPDDALAERCLVDALEREIERLAPSQRVVVHLVLVEMMTYEETAEILDVPVGTVRSRLSRARATLCASLAGLLDRGLGRDPVRARGRLKLVAR